MEWFDPAYDRGNWRALVNAVMKLGEFLDYLRTC
jgi:hypothetical protein